MEQIRKIRVSDIDILSQISTGDNFSKKNKAKAVDKNKTGLESLINEIHNIANSVFSEEAVEGSVPIKNVFLEYSSVAVMLSEKKMIGFAVLDENNDSGFNTNVKKFAFNVIGALQNAGMSIYAHPDFISSNSTYFDDLGMPCYSSFDTEYDIDFILRRYDLSLEQITKGYNNNNNRILDDLYWSGTYDCTFEQLLASIEDFNNRFKEGTPSMEDILTIYKECYDVAFAQNEKRDSEYSCFVGIPILGAKAGDMPISGQGATFVYFTYDKNAPKEKIVEFVKLIGRRLDYILKSYFFNLLAYSALRLREETTKESIKTAVSTIMSRNMSHNIGSHYLYYTKGYLENLANSSREKGPDIRGAARVLGYMQARMDYLATVISNDRYSYGSVNFKSQIYDELTVDDFSKRHFSNYKERGKRTTNFLLSNLVMSENFTRFNILDKNVSLEERNIGEHFKPIRLQVILWEGDVYQLFTGASDEETFQKEIGIKNKLSRLNIALPGGAMSCHAFFNIIENFIRNSAKYLQEDFQPEGLVFTIAIKRNEETDNAYDFVIFDNKHNAEKVLDVVNKQLEELSILDNYGKIEKSSRGIKEMMFSAVWMRSYQYKNESFADIINHIQSTKNGRDKLSMIEKYGFQFVAVTEEGRVKESSVTGKDNLGIRFTLPAFSVSQKLVVDASSDIISKALGVSSDFICIESRGDDSASEAKYSSYFPRCYFDNDFNENEFQKFLNSSNVISKDFSLAKDVYKFKCILDKRFKKESGGNIDNVCLWMGDRRDMKKIPSDEKVIYFERHFNTKKDFDVYTKYAYVDTISGGNFTITLNSLIEDGLNTSCKYLTWDDKLFGLKIKESALTRITLIDERLYNSMKSDGELKEKEYSFKNIRILNINLDKANMQNWSIEDFLEGNSFRDNCNKTHFLSIHMGLVEKVVKSGWGNALGKVMNAEDRVKPFMKQLAQYFSGKDEKVFISIHSGRGDLSKELEGDYPFISLAAIEAALNNSKYLLAQLFYNKVYFGKRH